MKIGGCEKAALLLIAVGEELASEILKRLDPNDIPRVISYIKKVKPTKEVIDKTLEEFCTQMREDFLGVDDRYIKEMLSKAIGAEQAERLLERSTGSTTALDTLKWLDTSRVSNFLKTEHPQTIAIVLAHMEPDRSAKIINELPEDLKSDVAVRIANLDRVSSDIVIELEEALQNQLKNIGEGRKVGGIKAVAEILNQIDQSTEKTILEQIEVGNSEMADEIKKLMFIFDDLQQIDDRSVQMILKEVSTEELALALKVASDSMKEKFFQNMSQRAAQILNEDIETRGPTRISEVENAQQNIVKVAKRLEEEGKIVLGSRGGEEIV